MYLSVTCWHDQVLNISSDTGIWYRAAPVSHARSKVDSLQLEEPVPICECQWKDSQ